MRTNGEPVSLRIGDRTILLGDSANIVTRKDCLGRMVSSVTFKPYWPGLLHAVSLMADERRKNRKKAR